MNKLHIDDYKKVKITKVREWAVHFKYEKRMYLLHLSSDAFEHSATLYERKMLEGKKYELEYVRSIYSGSSVYGRYIKYTDEGKTYKDMDKNYFIRKMTKDGLCSSYMDTGKYTKGLKEINSRIVKQKLILRRLEDARDAFVGE